VHVLETRESSRIGRLAKPFFILEVCGPQSHGTRGSVGALPSRETGSGAMGEKPSGQFLGLIVMSH
jgi:hypothetical protein